MHKFLFIFPRSVQNFLLTQPLPDHWIVALRQHIEEEEEEKEDNDPHGHRLDLSEGWKQSYNLILAMVILFLSAMVMYLILR